MTGTTTGTWVTAVSVAELDDGDAMRFDHEGRCVAVYNAGGTFYASAGICSHEHAFMSEGYLDGHIIECPLHQALFDIRTGANLSPPATKSLQTYPTRVENGKVMVLLG
ncbi:non-heme iron oxygenase ferredoxin subunit [Paracoccus sp. IB05]|uniref:non-heme iron oxygenase ferredoxin subunit n=1 Tax=Paracoccus sp. IB05 TaxID=2779367 RepID=UPI0018E8CBF6|nr:non-heme iron oxygenase ferredoxin subunit [Paracoccus sp. IB05]MBJ2153018.1 non-heme iron oxygenase ferredoxin subunit [Paracoccus sp. IB05]